MHIRAIRGSFRRRVWHSCHTHATLLGGAAVPAAPTKHSCTNINYPTEFTEFTEASGRGYSPTDFTDAHRWLGCVGFSHRIHRSFWQRIFSHRFHRCSQIWRVWHPAIPTPPSEVLPQNSQNPQKFLVENILPQISQMLTDLEGMASCHTHTALCQFSHRIHGIHRSFWRKIFSHGFHRCSQMVRLRRVLWLLWEDSLVAAWVWQDAIPS